MFIKDLFHRAVSSTREQLFSALALTAVGTLLFILGKQVVGTLADEHVSFTFADLIIYLSLLFIAFGNSLYIVMRYAYFQRLKSHRPATEEELDTFFHPHAPSLTILVPSYKEEISVVRQTMLCSALQEYPSRRVVLLIDDPHAPSNQEERELLEKARALPGEIEALLVKKRHRLHKEWTQYHYRKEKGKSLSLDKECAKLAKLHHEVADWFEQQLAMTTVNNHVDDCFTTLVYKPRIEKHRQRAEAAAKNEWSEERIAREYSCLASIFKVELTSFERKRYDNLSHAPNKAMNLNSYIALMGKQFIEIPKGDTLLLEERKAGNADLAVADSDYVAVLDADTILTHDYAARLIQLMEQKEHGQIAVTQTPYSAFPNPKGVVERIAGATTDLQYIVHQGFTSFNATFWVGANAIVRKAALEQIAEQVLERGYLITKFIHDRTVIEDTESSIDLVKKGWTLHNYPERLSYSATPEDFGSLLIQRRRWANGGLLILPKLFKYLFKRPWQLKKLAEGVIRFQYLASIAIALVMIVTMSFIPSRSSFFISWAILLSLPYLLIYGWDLKLAGYRFSDLFRVLALNIVLLPVNAAGVLQSLQQAVTRKQFPFCRTPKILHRTSVPPLYVTVETAMVIYSFWALYTGLSNGYYSGTGLLSLFFTLPVLYGYWTYLGLKNNLTDLLPLWYRLKQLVNYTVRYTIREPLLSYKGSVNGAVQRLADVPTPHISSSKEASPLKGKG